MALPPTEQELIARAIASALGDVYTAGPGIIQSYDPETQCADVLPAVKRALPTTSGDVAYEEIAVIPNVKVCFPRGGPFHITWPLAKGDSVLLVCCNYSINAWRVGNNAQTVLPGDLRTHAIGHAFAFPNLAIDSAATPNAQASQNAFIIHGPMVILGDQAATAYAALDSKVDANFAKIHNLFSGWTPAPNDGGAALKTASASLSFDPVKCEQVKIK